VLRFGHIVVDDHITRNIWFTKEKGKEERFSPLSLSLLQGLVISHSGDELKEIVAKYVAKLSVDAVTKKGVMKLCF